MEIQVCPNCSKKLNGLMTTKNIIDQETTNSINIFNATQSKAYCSGCAPSLVEKCREEIKNRKTNLMRSIDAIINTIPIITAQSPLKWDYKVIEIVSAQSVTGTGLLSELSSSWNDFLGNQSSALSGKLNNGENICKYQLRYKCALLGGNAVIATDIDYAEVGGVKGMLMVCMAGTAVEILNTQDVYPQHIESFSKLKTTMNEIIALDRIKFNIN